MNNVKNKDCNETQYELSDDIKNRYFPTNTQPEGYDVLPFYGLDDYNRRLMHSLSILENPLYAQKWQEFKQGLPYIAREAKIVTFKSRDKGVCFRNYRKQKVPLDYATRFIAPPSPGAIFYNKSK